MKRTPSLPGLFIIFILLLTACGKSGAPVSTVGTGEAPVVTSLPGETATASAGTDLSALSYSQAFDEMFAVIRRDYAFNGVAGKEPVWEALYAEVRPRVEQAEQAGDAQAYFLALRDLTLAFRDGQVNLGGGDMQVALFQAAIQGGYGFAIRELDDGRALVTYVTPEGPAAQAGMQAGAQVLEFNDQPVSTAIEAASIWGAPPSTESLMRLQKSRYLLRAPLGSQARVTFANPGGEAETVTLTNIEENESFAVSSVFLNYNAQALPVESKILPSGAGYIKVSSTSDDQEKIQSLFESALENFRTAGVTGLIIDLRVVVNLTTEPDFPLIRLAGYFTEQEILLGQFQYLNETTGKFEAQGEMRSVQPRSSRYQFSKVVVLVGHGCSNACELEAYALARLPNVIIAGQTPSAGVLSDVTGGQFLLPEGFSLQIPTGRFVSAGGEILLEGQGVPLMVSVPVDETTVLSTDDLVLTAAEAIAAGQ